VALASPGALSLAQALRAAILDYRQRLAVAPPELAKEVVRYLDLTAPLQVFSFEFRDPEWQYVLFVHSPKATDLLIDSRVLHRWEARAAFDEVLDKELWQVPMPQTRDEFSLHLTEPDADLRVAGENLLQFALQNLGFWSMQPPQTRLETRVYLNGAQGKCMYFDHRGSSEHINLTGSIDEAFKEGADNLDRSRVVLQPPAMPVASTTREPQFAIHGAYVVPRIRVGRLKKRTLGDLAAADQAFPGITVLQDAILGIPVRITHNGFIGLSTPRPEDALTRLNLVSAALLRLGHQAFVVREQDLASLHEPREGGDHGWGGRYSGTERQRPGRSDYLPWSGLSFRTAEFQSVLRQAEQIEREPWAPYVRDFLEAHSHLLGHEAPQSILFSWTIIERWVYDTWRRANGGTPKGPRFAERMYWLAGKGTIPEPMLMDILQVRSVRNRVVHEKASASLEEATHALVTVEHLISPDGIRRPIDGGT